MDVTNYYQVLAKYISQQWNDDLLASYYKSKAPLYTDSVAISTRPSEAAPAAFGLENEVKPGLWIIHYHAKVTAPAAGNYRFAGLGDNVLLVKIKGAVVFDGGWTPLTPNEKLHKTLPFAFSSYAAAAASGLGVANLKVGETFRLDAGEAADIDILIGDDGGVCSFFLLIENMDETYDLMDDGTPKLPFFQLSPKPAPTFSTDEEHPPYSTTPEPWQGVEE